MVKFITAISALLVVSTSAFTPANVPQTSRPDVSLSMTAEKPSKRARVLKHAGKIAGAVASAALMSGGVPPAFASTKKAVEVVETSTCMLETAKQFGAGIGAGVGAAALVGAIFGGESTPEPVAAPAPKVYKQNPNWPKAVSDQSVESVAAPAKQDFLEADPYWDQSNVPVNVYKNKAPFTGKVVSTKRIVGPKATGETCHIVIDHEGDFPYWEGQSWGVIPPGVREKDGKPHSVRLYSIASSRYGDDMSGKTGSLCVRRATYWCPEMKADDPAKKGVCSNFLCDTKAGDEVQMTGPAGKVMLMPEEDPKTDLIMVATGTGIAPYRGFIRRLFTEKTPAGEAYEGTAWLFLGVANSDALLYDDEWQEVKKNYPDNFRLDYALSREQENKKGGKMYIQDKVEEYADEIFTKLDNGAHIYFCGLKGMMPGIQDMLKGVAESKGLDYDEWLKGLKKSKQWHVEVY
ncbi:ferredoxin--NADP+ reductase [Chaetoceros tenuissimus]|uniref:ferredoxin--NADP(+) reductase n=1 Tax=Chaetoceros tenuissimus TaxID=426638 RepID=A0AAD3H7Q0_9STRA|nr:ferredoxin--NADP+ reductase [Chaetoceros tenuissimus]